MKKIVSIILALAMILSFAACGAEPGNESLYSEGLTKEGRYDIKATDYVTLPSLENLDFGKEFWEVDEASVQSQLDSIKSSLSTTQQVTDRAVVEGDSVNIDYSGTLDGEPVDNTAAAGQMVVAGSTTFVDNMLDSLIGRMPGETYDVDATFPDTYENNPDLAGKTLVFTITINYISETVQQELTDEIVAEKYGENLGVKTVNELELYISDYVLKNAQSTTIDNYLYDNSTVTEVPQVIIDHQTKVIRQQYQDAATSYGLDVDTLASYYGAESLDALMEAASSQIEEMARDYLIFQAVAETLNIKVENKDVADYFEANNGSRDYSAMQTTYGLPYLKMAVMADKIMEYMIGQVAQ